MSASSQRWSVPPTQDILGDFKAFLQKLENISWVKTVANTTGNFNKFSSDISALSEHEIQIIRRIPLSAHFIIKLNTQCVLRKVLQEHQIPNYGVIFNEVSEHKHNVVLPVLPVLPVLAMFV